MKYSYDGIEFVLDLSIPKTHKNKDGKEERTFRI